mmetsp:Transcript_11103/g.17127  ORF Transcript_11103/g.17127 Transcript_11103/m.17127 type:complete len:249 (+) Transcript_11103:90-836(+)
MVWSIVQNLRQGAQFRGGWWNLVLHMYTNGDFPFKFGTYMGCDSAGNRYYENRVDYPFGQHRWVEPGDVNNFDSASIPPEWHGWMTSMNDAPPNSEDDYVEAKKPYFIPLDIKSDAPAGDNLGHQEALFNFKQMHNQSQIRSRGYNIGNPILNLPPNVPDAYYTQPGSPYHPDFIKKRVDIGDLDEAAGGGRPYKSEKWADRLRTTEEKEALKAAAEEHQKKFIEKFQNRAKEQMARRSRGGTIIGSR